MIDMNRIEHVGIAVRSLKEAVATYEKMGFQISSTEEVEKQKVRVAFIKLGESRIELLEPTTPDSPIAKFLDKKGAGIHHMAIEVDDLKAKLKELKQEDFRLIDKKPRQGAHGLTIAFIHPKATHGVLLELCQQS